MPDHTRIHEVVQTLYFMTPSQLELMETRREVILSAASELKAFETPSALSWTMVYVFYES